MRKFSGNKKLLSVVGAATVVLFVSGCGASNGAAAKSPRSTSPGSPTTSAAPIDPNIANCSDVQDTILKVRDIFQSWDIDHDMFDKGVADRLREQATHLYSLEGKATGPAKDAIHEEAAGLVDLSMAIEGADPNAVGDASDRANRALAAVRGTCNF
jgi:hypothetical protein